MSKSSKGDGIKIAQAAKDLGVTSVTIRRYISEFDIETTEDENGIKVLPQRAMDELHEVRKLKEDGMTNPQVLEHLVEMRSKREKEKPKAEPKRAAKRITEAPAKKDTKKAPTRGRKVVEADDEDDDEDEDEEEAKPTPPTRGRASRVKEAPPVADDEDESDVEEAPAARSVDENGDGAEPTEGADAGDGRSKHNLTCQTCGKNFEHMNPRLRDCLDCYRTKRKERRRDKHKNVIQHPLAAQVTSKQQQRQMSDSPEGEATFDVTPRTSAPGRERGDRDRDRDRGDRGDRAERGDRADRGDRESAPLPMSSKRINPLAGTHKATVRNYRKAIEETRGITANLKRRLERPDLPENERRWLEQIYAYQLILHQGWRHLAEYKAGTPAGSGAAKQET